MKLSTICFLIRDDMVLLSNKKRGFGKDFLNGYGGKVKEGETPESSLVRELSEEARIDADQGDLEKVAVIDFFDGDAQVFECHVFFLRDWAGQPTETEEMAKPEPFALNKIPYDRMWKADKDWLPLVFSGKRIHAKAYYKPGMNEMDRFEYLPL